MTVNQNQIIYRAWSKRLCGKITVINPFTCPTWSKNFLHVALSVKSLCSWVEIFRTWLTCIMWRSDFYHAIKHFESKNVQIILDKSEPFTLVTCEPLSVTMCAALASQRRRVGILLSPLENSPSLQVLPLMKTGDKYGKKIHFLRKFSQFFN